MGVITPFITDRGPPCSLAGNKKERDNFGMKLVCFMAVMRFIPSKAAGQPVLVPYPFFWGGGSLWHTSKEKLFRGK